MKLNRREPEKLLFELSSPGKIGLLLPEAGVEVPEANLSVPAAYRRTDIPGFPELSQVEVVRHYTRLSSLNHSVDHGFYPLGSCTMKHNPKINEAAARIPRFAGAHPALQETYIQGSLELMYLLEEALKAVTGLARVTLQPNAGAHGEWTALMMIRKAHQKKGNPRKVVLIPDSAHGTNPASSVFAGYTTKEIKSGPDGLLDLAALEKEVNEEVAALMVTCPNTLGIFEEGIADAARILHAKGAYLYLDGANFNSFMGIASPKKMGVDLMHINLHKTFSTPHGGGGPGAGPVAVAEGMVPFLPMPMVEKTKDGYRLDFDRPDSIGRVRAFHAQFAILVRAYAYILTLGGEGLTDVSKMAVLLANYLRARLKDTYAIKYSGPSLHEVVFDDTIQAKRGVKNVDIVKRLLDFGIHPPTLSFPLIVHGALMVEPTETESKAELDRFVAAMKAIAEEAEQDPDFVKGAPYTTPVKRLDEVRAARTPVLRWKK